MGSLKFIPDGDVKTKLTSDELDLDGLAQIGKEFIALAQTGDHTAFGFSNSFHGMSKALEIGMTRIQQKKFDACHSKPGISVMACHPAFVDTDMTSHRGKLTIEAGADTPIYLALLPKGETKHNGLFTNNRKINPWEEADITEVS